MMWTFFLLIVGAVVVLNYPGYLIERTGIVHRAGVPCLLLVGLIGSLRQTRTIRGARILRAIGWMAIIWFIPAIMYSTPDLEHSGPEFRGFPTLWRVMTTILLFFAMLALYWMLRIRRSGRSK
jgi:hypothetical protein